MTTIIIVIYYVLATRRRQWHPTPVLLPGKSHGRRSLVGCRAWWAAVHGISKSWTRLSDFTFTFHFHALEKEMATHSSSFLENPRDGRAWWAAAYGVAQSRTRLKRLSSSSSNLDWMFKYPKGTRKLWGLPEMLLRVRKELQSIFESSDWEKMNQLIFVSHCVQGCPIQNLWLVWRIISNINKTMQ